MRREGRLNSDTRVPDGPRRAASEVPSRGACPGAEQAFCRRTASVVNCALRLFLAFSLCGAFVRPVTLVPAAASVELWHRSASPVADADNPSAPPSAGPPDQPGPIQPGTTQRPFLNLRDATLGYHGPDEERADLAEYCIGWFGPTNLDHALAGDLWWAATLAVEAANSRRAARSPNPQSPLDRLESPSSNSLPFRLVARWSENVWGTGVSQLARMIYEERPIAVIGSVDSASTHLAEQVVAKANLPLVSPIATDPSVTLAGVPWMFSCAPSDRAIARVLVDDVLRTLESARTWNAGIRGRSGTAEGATPTADRGASSASGTGGTSTAAERGRGARLALITVTDHESRMTARELVREFARRRRVPDFRFEVPPGAENLERQQAAIEETRPDVILIVGGAEDAARLVRALRGSSVREQESASESGSGEGRGDGAGVWPGPVVFGSQSMGRTRFLQLVGSAGEGVRFPRLCIVDPTDADTARFIARFAAARQHPPDCAAILAYDATRLLLEAIRRAGSSRAGVRNALAAISPWQGIGGIISFDGTGQNSRTNVAMAAVRAGRIVCADESGRGGGAGGQGSGIATRSVCVVLGASAGL